ncbi:hypothetical protein VSK91_05625 [Bacillus swezeyi]|uniref:hypothetical protein n=1 Tax=Bacillus swezeyi TaxID=1925020 RepID=UPI0039C6B00F
MKSGNRSSVSHRTGNKAMIEKPIPMTGMSNMGSLMLLIAGLLIIIICSYGISLSFYKKREF